MTFGTKEQCVKSYVIDVSRSIDTITLEIANFIKGAL